MSLTNIKKSVIKKYGEGSVMNLTDMAIKTVKPICTTGFSELDRAIGIKGYPLERMIEIFGPESGGKTTLALHACKEIQKIGGNVVYLDVEHALDPYYAKNGIGVNVNDILLSQPDYGEQALDIVLHIIQKQKEDNSKPMLIVIDSVDALVPKKERDGDIDLDAEGAQKGKGGMGLRARLMSDVCRKVTSNLKGSNTTVIFINQIRMKIGVMFGSPETTSGGVALKFYASLRLDIRNIGQVKIGETPGNQFRIKVKKNKVAPPFKEYEGLNIHGKGFQPEWDLFTVLKDTGKIEKKGSWFTLKDNKKKFQGYGGFLELMGDDTFRQSVETMTTM